MLILFELGVIMYVFFFSVLGLIIQYWNEDINIGIFIVVFFVIFMLVNYFFVGIYGEFEMWLLSLKVIIIFGFIIFVICIVVGVGQQGVIGFKYWRE